MGANGSKDNEVEEGLPARYARGCATSEFARKPRVNAMNRTLNDQSKRNGAKIGKAFDSASDPSVKLLDKTMKNYNSPPRLQSLGTKQKSYLDYLIDLRTKNTERVPVSVNNTWKEQREAPRGKRTLPSTNNESGHHHGSGDQLMRKMALISCKKSSNRDPTEPWTESSSDDAGSSLDANISMNSDSILNQIRSDITVVPYDQARARFETGLQKKRPKNNEAYRQLEELGLGYWNNDQCLTKK